MRRIAAAFMALTLGLGLEACDRCAGVLGCTSNPRLSIGGQLIVRETGAPVGGVALDFVRTGGVAIATDSVETTTDPDGRFQLAVDATDIGEVVGDLVVRAPTPWSPYRVRGLRFRTSEIRGEGQVLGRLVVDPYVEFIGVLYDRRTGHPLDGARVTIQRTGGVVTSPDRVETTSDSLGRIFYDARAAEPGDVVADVVVGGSSLLRTSRLPGVRITAAYLDRVPEIAGVWRIGAGLPYVGVLYRRVSGARSAGIAVEFQRTGGIAADPDTFVVATNADGAFSLVTTPLADGVLVGNLIVRPPSPAVAETIQAVRLQTVDTEPLILLGVWGYGYGAIYGGQLWLRSSRGPAAGLDVEFRRTGGMAITPDNMVARTDSAGRFPLVASADGAGEVVGDLTVRLPAPFPPAVISGVRIATFASDQMRLLGYWGVGSGLPYVGVLSRRGSGVREAGIGVEFQRTGGIGAKPDTFAVSTNADGAFSLVTAPLADGALIGNLIVRPPPPAVAETIQAVRLQTVDSEPLILLGVWVFGHGIHYGGQLWLRGTEGPAAGLEVEFRRTGGVAITPDNLFVRTDSAGRFPLAAAAAGPGDVVGDLTVRLPSPLPPTVISGVHVATYASDEMRYLGYWGVGPSLRYLGQVLRADTDAPIADAVVEFQRTSGIAVAPSVLTSRTIASGLFPLAPNPLDTGEVVGNLTIRPPAPFRDTTFTGIRLRTFDGDTLRLGGVWRIAPPP